MTVSLKLVRPYQTLEEFLDNDAWTVSRSELVLLDEPAPPEGTIVGFEIGLATGQTLVRGEGSVVGLVEPQGTRSGGFRVRLRKLYASSKSVLKSALDRQRSAQQNDAPPPAAAVAPPELQRSGVHQLPPRVVSPPPNREELLRRLRERARRLQEARVQALTDVSKRAS